MAPSSVDISFVHQAVQFYLANIEKFYVIERPSQEPSGYTYRESSITLCVAYTQFDKDLITTILLRMIRTAFMMLATQNTSTNYVSFLLIEKNKEVQCTLIGYFFSDDDFWQSRWTITMDIRSLEYRQVRIAYKRPDKFLPSPKMNKRKKKGVLL